MTVTKVSEIFESALTDPLTVRISRNTFISACSALGWSTDRAADLLGVNSRQLYNYRNGAQKSIPKPIQRLLLCHLILAGYDSFDTLPDVSSWETTGKRGRPPGKASQDVVVASEPVQKLRANKKSRARRETVVADSPVPIHQVSDFSFE
jgi:hypothetical protein